MLAPWLQLLLQHWNEKEQGPPFGAHCPPDELDEEPPDELEEPPDELDDDEEVVELPPELDEAHGSSACGRTPFRSSPPPGPGSGVCEPPELLLEPPPLLVPLQFDPEDDPVVPVESSSEHAATTPTRSVDASRMATEEKRGLSMTRPPGGASQAVYGLCAAFLP